MNKSEKPPFASKKEAFSSFFSWFTAPVGFIGMGVYAVVWWSNHSPMPFETAKNSIFLVVILFVGVLIYSWYRAFQALKAINNKDFDNIVDPPEVVMCVKCLEPLYWKDTNGINCVKCGGLLEDVVGFYDRHPELR